MSRTSPAQPCPGAASRARALALAAAANEAIRAHGRTAYPDECCGALLGRDGVVREAHRVPNATGEGPRRRFLVRPGDYRAAETRARETGLDLLGFYHSHPDHQAVPSQYDLDHAWPSLHYVILSVGAGADADLRAWVLSDDRSQFHEVSVSIQSLEPRAESPRQTP